MITIWVKSNGLRSECGAKSQDRCRHPGEEKITVCSLELTWTHLQATEVRRQLL